MKLLVILAFVALGATAPQAQRPGPNPDEIQLLRYENENDGLGSYRFAYEQSDGTKREEQGELKNVGAENEAMTVQGSYTWIAPEGITYLVTFVADENGFKPKVEQVSGGSGAPRG